MKKINLMDVMESLNNDDTDTAAAALHEWFVDQGKKVQAGIDGVPMAEAEGQGFRVTAEFVWPNSMANDTDGYEPGDAPENTSNYEMASKVFQAGSEEEAKAMAEAEINEIGGDPEFTLAELTDGMGWEAGGSGYNSDPEGISLVSIEPAGTNESGGGAVGISAGGAVGQIAESGDYIDSTIIDDIHGHVEGLAVFNSQSSGRFEWEIHPGNTAVVAYMPLVKGADEDSMVDELLNVAKIPPYSESVYSGEAEGKNEERLFFAVFEPDEDDIGGGGENRMEESDEASDDSHLNQVEGYDNIVPDWEISGGSAHIVYEITSQAGVTVAIDMDTNTPFHSAAAIARDAVDYAFEQEGSPISEQESTAYAKAIAGHVGDLVAYLDSQDGGEDEDEDDGDYETEYDDDEDGVHESVDDLIAELNEAFKGLETVSDKLQNQEGAQVGEQGKVPVNTKGTLPNHKGADRLAGKAVEIKGKGHSGHAMEKAPKVADVKIKNTVQNGKEELKKVAPKGNAGALLNKMDGSVNTTSPISGKGATGLKK